MLLDIKIKGKIQILTLKHLNENDINILILCVLYTDLTIPYVKIDNQYSTAYNLKIELSVQF